MSIIDIYPNPTTSVLRYWANGLREVIFASGIYMTEIESAIGRSRGFICHAANREKTVSAIDAYAIASFLHCAVDSIFVLDDESSETLSEWRAGRIIAIDGPHARFWSKVRRPDDSDACWEWIGSRCSNGYGRIMVDRTPAVASRYAYEATYGPFDLELDVLHNCDNPPCVRPDHLRLGTHTDNMHDMMIRGRRKKWGRKLTVADVIEIRRIAPQTPAEKDAIADQYHVTRETIRQILMREAWRQI